MFHSKNHRYYTNVNRDRKSFDSEILVSTIKFLGIIEQNKHLVKALVELRLSFGLLLHRNHKLHNVPVYEFLLSVKNLKFAKTTNIG